MRPHRWILVFLTGLATQAAAIDCSKASTSQEKAICSSPDLKAADDRMSASYWKVFAATPEDMKAAVREDQLAWLRSRAFHCNPTASTDLPRCLLGFENARTNALQHLILHSGGVTFVWRSITLTEPDDPEDRPQLGQEVNPGYGTMSASWPQAASDTPEWTTWNKAIEAEVKKTSGWPAQSAIDNDAWVSINAVGKQLVAATISYFEDSHGAHPNHGSIEFNWLLDKQRELRPEDVFKPGSNWVQTLQKQTDAYLHHQLDQGSESYETFLQPGEMQKTLHNIVINSQNWHLGDKGLSIVFQPYAVACYACTPPPFTIPWANLKPILNPDFVIPGPIS